MLSCHDQDPGQAFQTSQAFDVPTLGCSLGSLDQLAPDQISASRPGEV